MSWVNMEWMVEVSTLLKPRCLKRAMLSFEWMVQHRLNIRWNVGADGVAQAVEQIASALRSDFMIPPTARIVRLDLPLWTMNYQIIVEDQSFPPIQPMLEVPWFEWSEPPFIVSQETAR